MRRILLWLVLAGLIGFGLLQLVPYGKDHTNPPTVSEPAWDTPSTRAAAKQHCFQCHSNETEWPWYTNIAPGSWLIYRDVVEARDAFNFSDWENLSGDLGSMIGEIKRGGMPPIQYWIVHPGARLTPEEKQALIEGLTATLGP
jgi:hypothetical protein